MEQNLVADHEREFATPPQREAWEFDGVSRLGREALPRCCAQNCWLNARASSNERKRASSPWRSTELQRDAGARARAQRLVRNRGGSPLANGRAAGNSRTTPTRGLVVDRGGRRAVHSSNPEQGKRFCTKAGEPPNV